MIRYIDWVQTVLRVCLADRPSHSPLTVGKVAEEVGLPLGGLRAEERNPIILGLDRVLRDLAPHGFVIYDSGGHTIEYPPAARRFRTEPLTAAWSELRSGYLDPDDEAFLAALAALSEKAGDDRADVEEVDGHDAFAALGWEWDGSRAFAIYAT